MLIFLVLLASSSLLCHCKSIPKLEKCGKDQTAFFVSDNSALNVENSIIYKDISEDECLKSCSDNKDQEGKALNCQAFSYDHPTFTCTVYSQRSLPLGSESVQTVPGQRYFEKICLTQPIPERCGSSQFIRVDQSVLVGYAVNLTAVSSLELCVEYCAREVECKSAMYFYEDGDCITSNESALTKPTAFQKESKDKVVYFQNGCDSSKTIVSSDDTKVEKEPEVVTTEKPVPETTQAPQEEPEPKVEDLTEVEDVKPVEEVVEKKPAAIDENEYEEEGEEYSDEVENVEEEVTTTTTTEQPPKKFKHLSLKKKKNPKNFASKTYEILKKSKVEKKQKALESEYTDDTEASLESERSLKIKKIEDTTNYFSDWSDWTPCTKSDEKQIRRRRCLNLRKCLGALMQVQNCPALAPVVGKTESLTSIVGQNGEDYDTPNFNFQPEAVVSRPTEVVSEPVWGHWQGVCQHFASSQPCNNGKMIGFESRECIAKDPAKCEGPFFRYCTLTC